MQQSSKYLTKFFLCWLGALLIFIGGISWITFIYLHDIPLLLGTTVQKESFTPIPQEKVPNIIIPSFDTENDAYVLLAFPSQGMQQITDAEPLWTLLPAGTVLTAQLIKRGPQPDPIKSGVIIRYTVEGNMTSSDGKPIKPGEMTWQDEPPGFVSLSIPLMPYTESGDFMPYPTALIEAVDQSTGKLLLQTRVTLPISTEIGCHNCHTGPWKTKEGVGIDKQTAGDILAMHDKRSGTELVKLALSGTTVDCRSCHADNKKEVNLSTAIHGFHATMGLNSPDACDSCHPSSSSGKTIFFHDVHAMWGLDCTRCHGSMTQNAVSLLKTEVAKNKESAKKRLASLDIDKESASSITPRSPWVNLPDCTTCHDFEKKPDPSTASAFNKWTNNASELLTNNVENTGNIRCAACHGPQHAVYPSNNPLGDDRDNIQPLQYQKLAGPIGVNENCAVCHTQAMPYFIHHGKVEQN